MYALRIHTEGCNPISPDIESEDFDEIKEQALAQLKWIEERAFGAADTEELEAHDDREMYGDLVGKIEGLKSKSVGNGDKMASFGPLPCGYIIEIEELAA